METQTESGSWLLEAFRRGGVDTGRLSQEYPREVASALTDQPNLDFHDADTLLGGCARLTGNQSFGLHMIDFTELSMFGTYGYLLSNAPTVKRLFEIIELYFPIFYRGPRVSVKYSEPSCIFEYDGGGLLSESRRHVNEWTLGFFAKLISKHIGCHPFIIHAEFTNSPPADLTGLKQIFGENISFNASRTAFEFRSDILDRTIPGCVPHFFDILVDQAESFSQETLHQESLEAGVKLLILEYLESGGASIEAIAHRLAMSRTTLNRRLATKGTSFRKLRDTVISQVAKKALIETNIAVNELAHKLGFSETSTFDRSFRRISGMSPTLYRQTKR